MLKSHRVRFMACLLALVFAGCNAEFGDAPDGAPTNYPAGFAQNGQFPTLEASNGARTNSVSEATLGAAASLEADANDAQDPDGQPNLSPSNTDSDDGLLGLTVVLTSIPPPAAIQVQAQGGTGGDFFLNVLIDLNLDGKWGGQGANGEPEWAVQNLPATVPPSAATTINSSPFPFANGFVFPDGAWMRVALTGEQIPGPDWDGTGEFASGEIEDHMIRLPIVNGKKVAIPLMQCPSRVSFQGMPTVLFPCVIFNFGPAGQVAYSLTRANGGVMVVGPPIDPNPGQFAAPAGALGLNFPTVLWFTARRALPLPSDWTYTARGVDPPTQVDAQGVTIGYDDSAGTVTFVDEPLEEPWPDIFPQQPPENAQPVGQPLEQGQ